MIFVTVGTQKFSFERLLKEIDGLVESGKLSEDVFAQIGTSSYLPRNYRYEKFMSEDFFNRKLEECTILVTHGGVGTITKGLRLKKLVVIVPRLKKYHEHVDNHQLEIAKAFEEKRFALSCENIDKLENCLGEINKKSFKEYSFSYAGVIQCVRNFVLNGERKQNDDSKKR